MTYKNYLFFYLIHTSSLACSTFFFPSRIYTSIQIKQHLNFINLRNQQERVSSEVNIHYRQKETKQTPYGFFIDSNLLSKNRLRKDVKNKNLIVLCRKGWLLSKASLSGKGETVSYSVYKVYKDDLFFNSNYGTVTHDGNSNANAYRVVSFQKKAYINIIFVNCREIMEVWNFKQQII